MDKALDPSSTNSDDNIDPILCVIGEDKDPNFQDVQSHDRSNYLRERHWIKQASPIERWKTVNCLIWLDPLNYVSLI